MRVQSNGKVKRTASEWREILRRFETSGLSQAAFCRRETLAKGSFSNWKRRLEEDEALGARPGTFVELGSAPSEPPSARLDSGELELLLPGGVCLRWKV